MWQSHTLLQLSRGKANAPLRRRYLDRRRALHFVHQRLGSGLPKCASPARKCTTDRLCIDSQLSRHLAFAKSQTIVRLGNEADNGLSSRAAARAVNVAAPAPHYVHRERMRAKTTAIIALQIIDGDFLRDYWASSQYWQCAAPRDPTLTRAVREWSPFSMIIHWVLSLGHLAVGIHTP